MKGFERLEAARKAGNNEEVERLYVEYGPSLKRIARLRIKELRLESELEPDDIFDSVFRVVLLDPSRLDDMQPWQVYAYLEQMIRHKARDVQRRRAAKKRGTGATAKRVDLYDVASRDANVSDEFALQDEIDLTSAKLTGVERMTCMYRNDKYTWEEIGELMAMTATAVQKRHERALSRVVRERPRE